MTPRRRLAVVASLLSVVLSLGLAAAAGLAAATCTPAHPCVYLPLVVHSGPPVATTYKLVMNQILLPQQRTDYAIDLNGDGRVDNQLGNLVGALSSQGLDLQGIENQAIQSGTALELVSLRTVDPLLKNDGAATSTLRAAQPTVPDFSGHGTFAVDAAVPPALFAGTLAAGAFQAANPVTAATPVSVTLRLALFSSAHPIPLTLNGAHIQFTTAAGPPPSLLGGQIHGSIKESDLQTQVIPAIAARLTEIVQADPSSSQAQQIEAIFDTGSCTNPNGSAAKAGDHVIDICEVAHSGLIQSLLAPDVQIYDAQGHYAPNPANTAKDSFSVGLGFTAVSANY